MSQATCIETKPSDECPHCKPTPEAVNWVPGHIFVGWGQGWQPCMHCHGSQRLPIEANACQPSKGSP